MHEEELLNPVGEVEKLDLPLAPRLDGLEGKVLGIIDNAMRGASPFMARIEAGLKERFRFTAVVKRQKARGSSPSPQALLDELAQQCQAVVYGVGL